MARTMAEVEVKNLENKVVEKLKLADQVFNYSASETLVWEAVRAYLAAQRKGTHATKGRAQVRGGGRKPWRQKGTGRARAGTIRSPLWRGGGTTFGPTPRNYTQAFPKKKRRGAMKLVLSDKLRNQSLTVLEDFSLESHRTQEFLSVLENFKLDKKVLLMDDRENRNLYLSSRNVPGVKLVATGGLNVYDLMNCRHFLVTKRAILALQEVLQR
ncbi:MAG: 50S ribosomal protein L4 [Acidobacteria bacterium]|nr:50S ribosomal protein L4 [Acidobacteriota bacterium]MCZ6876842.1 50S ribosomal protein L4 [Acidobacteriota bacterium]